MYWTNFLPTRLGGQWWIIVPKKKPGNYYPHLSLKRQMTNKSTNSGQWVWFTQYIKFTGSFGIWLNNDIFNWSFTVFLILKYCKPTEKPSSLETTTSMPGILLALFGSLEGKSDGIEWINYKGNEWNGMEWMECV